MIQKDTLMNKSSIWANKNARLSPSTEPVILCIDDEACSLEIRKLLLEQAGYRVVACRDGREGITVFSSTPVQLVVLDYSMPGLNGAEVVQAMRGIKPNVPILMLSAYPQPPKHIEDIVDSYMVKGGDPRYFLANVQCLLAGQNHSTSQFPPAGSKKSICDPRFLNSWKEVSKYVGRAVRTVQRWEKELGFPIHRSRAELRSPVIAIGSEIDEWIKNASHGRRTRS